jgi:hypothetical protein
LDRILSERPVDYYHIEYYLLYPSLCRHIILDNLDAVDADPAEAGAVAEILPAPPALTRVNPGTRILVGDYMIMNCRQFSQRSTT